MNPFFLYNESILFDEVFENFPLYTGNSLLNAEYPKLFNVNMQYRVQHIEKVQRKVIW